MIFSETRVAGARLIEVEFSTDFRGSFGRTFCVDEFRAVGIEFTVVQANVSTNVRARTLRGMHFQTGPAAEGKVVRCSQGSLFDVALDLRPDSPTYLEWVGYELTPVNGRMLYIPAGCAHGFLTLEDDTQVEYLMDARYSPEHSSGVRWNDPAFGVDWPVEPLVISERDATWPDWSG